MPEIATHRIDSVSRTAADMSEASYFNINNMKTKEEIELENEIIYAINFFTDKDLMAKYLLTAFRTYQLKQELKKYENSSSDTKAPL